MTTPADLPETWRSRASDLARYAPAAAEAFLTAATELEAVRREAAEEVLTLGEAAAASGYSQRRIRELIAQGKVPQAGRKGAPRIRRGDLPVRPGRSEPRGVYDPTVDADELAGRIL